MPTDRFLHPRAGHSRKVTMLTDMEYRVWTQYLLSADDFGVMRCSAVTLQADNDALAARKPTQLTRALERLIDCGLLRAFEHQGRRYVYQHDWNDWQKVSYPRGTDHPLPPPEALETCEATTRELFAIHPGGKGRKLPKRVEKIPETVQEYSGTVPESSENDSGIFPTTRAGAPADRLRLTANATGSRLTADANGGDAATGMDGAFRSFQEAYPQSRRKGGMLVEQAYLAQAAKAGGPHALIDALANHIASEQWRDPKLIPGMDTWLREERWRQVLPADGPPTPDTRRPAWVQAAAARGRRS